MYVNVITVNDANGKPTDLNIVGWGPEFTAYMLAYAHRVRMQRCTANVDPDKHQEAREAMFESMAKGEMPSSGGGGGSRLSVKDAAWIAYFNAKGSPVTFTKERANGKNLEKYQAAFVRKAIWPSIAKAIGALDKEAQMEFHKTRLPELVQQNKKKVLAIAETDPKGVGGFIEAERMKREGKQPQQFSVEIEINL